MRQSRSYPDASPSASPPRFHATSACDGSGTGHGVGGLTSTTAVAVTAAPPRVRVAVIGDCRAVLPGPTVTVTVFSADWPAAIGSNVTVAGSADQAGKPGAVSAGTPTATLAPDTGSAPMASTRTVTGIC